MKIQECRVLTWFILVWGMILFPLSAFAADSLRNSVLILADVSGSMQENMIWEDEDENKEDVPKVHALKKLLIRLNRELICDTGVYRVRHLSGNNELYEQFLSPGTYEQKERGKQIRDKFVTDYAVFNRRTPLADMFRQLDEQELEKIKGQLTLLLISDGRESFYDFEDDEEENRDEETEPEDDIRGPLSEIRRLKEKYGQNFILHTVFLGKKNKDRDDSGEMLLTRMASAAGGKHFSGTELLGNSKYLTDVCALLCPGEKIAATVRSEPEKESEPVMVVSSEPEKTPVQEPEEVMEEEPEDTDRDGIYDHEDKCLGTPVGAKVNKYGCWVLGGVLFETAKWNIRPQFYPELDEAMTVLKKNPDLKVEIQGHTDNVGTAAYNQKLSERRAESVMKYFMKKGTDPGRLSSSGYGFKKPVAPNTTPEGRTMNRRVELKPKK
ncbi:OmpA family protein [Desulfonema magnum]|uniref:OmpA-like domain-containing protein n=1 Tax=Desulfonema magnum TaxID=45655 RepID=A0A975BNB2_9BACT|nr:OmpA family protein [Desulfonema magnum]QTA88849.1 OmpA-like domain-containing protein [Desulfonema magnum]